MIPDQDPWKILAEIHRSTGTGTDPEHARDLAHQLSDPSRIQPTNRFLVWLRRLDAWITDISWTDAGTALALMAVGSILLEEGGNGRFLGGIACTIMGAIVYFRAPRTPSA